MILLDTHTWVWWVQDDPRLTSGHKRVIADNETLGLGVSAVSCWEVAKLVEAGRLVLPVDTLEWILKALAYPGVVLIPLTPQIAVQSTRLPGEFHRDPADQMIVATARELDIDLVTSDQRILAYPYVRLVR